MSLSTTRSAVSTNYLPLITAVPLLNCRNNSTVLTTTECTYGRTVSYCHSEPPPLMCSDGFFPSTFVPVRCATISTCYPLPTKTASCVNGFTAYATHTAFSGVLSNGSTTVIESPQCDCGGYVSWIYKPYASYCMPTSSCSDFFTSSTRIVSYFEDNSTITATRTFCNCPTSQTPVFASSTATTCADVVTESSISRDLSLTTTVCTGLGSSSSLFSHRSSTLRAS